MDQTDNADRPDRPGRPDTSGQADMPGTPEVSAAAAADRLQVNERTVRRWIERGKLPAVRFITTRGTPEYRISVVELDAFDAQRKSTAAISIQPAGQADRGPGQADIMPAALPALIEQAVHSAVAPLAATIERQATTIQQQAEEIGRLRERLRAAQQPQPAPAESVDREPTPPPTARPGPSWRTRAMRWWRS